ncbi:MAG: hypothetical protein PHN50_04905 [Bacteroidales bacterium]|nr:hypothetical protein [Bacteroidales bacterium]
MASLSHAIFCVACDSKYIDTSSSCRLESGIRQTFSADPKVRQNQPELSNLRNL